MSDYAYSLEPDDDQGSRPGRPDARAVGDGGGHDGSVETTGVFEVLHSGERGVDWTADSEQSGLDEWGFQRGEQA